MGPGADELAAAGGEPAGTLVEALRRTSGLTDRWIVRVDETAEPGLAECASVDEVTILTGSDEAAVVASYRLVKSLAAGWDRAFGEDAGPTLGLAIMGSSGEAALAASEKLERAAEAFLNRSIRVTARVPKIGVASAATMYRGNESPAAAEVLELVKSAPATAMRITPVDWRPAEAADEDLLQDIEFEADEHADTDEAWEPEAIVDEEEMVADEAADELAEGREDAGEAAVVTRPVFDVSAKAIERSFVREPVRVASAMAAADEIEHVSVREVEPAAAKTPAAAEAAAPVVIERIDDAVLACESDASAAALLGLTAIESRCPFAGNVDLAADEAGRLHLIARERFGGEREATTQLMAAASWARAHLALLLRAEPALSQPTADDPHEATMHLLTADARSVRAILDADVRVHLVTRVALGGRIGWVENELN
ncbi:MAG: hypothetical protein R3B49_06270 [Phycisphaerales bacterium]